jgi:hypothetical protein
MRLDMIRDANGIEHRLTSPSPSPAARSRSI